MRRVSHIAHRTVFSMLYLVFHEKMLFVEIRDK